MAKLTTAARKRIPKASFAVPSKAPKSGSYPVNDINHARAALSRSAGKPIAAQVKRKVKSMYPSMKISGLARAK